MKNKYISMIGILAALLFILTACAAGTSEIAMPAESEETAEAVDNETEDSVEDEELSKLENSGEELPASSDSVDSGESNPEEPEEAVREKLSTEELKKKITDLEKSVPAGYEFMEAKPFYLTGNRTPEILEIVSEEATFPDSNIVMVNVYQYSFDSKQWESIWVKEFEEYGTALQIITSGQIMGDNREQVAFGKWEGSGGFLSFIILGSKDKESVSVLLEDWNGGISNGEVEFEGSKIVVKENDSNVVNVLQWKEE